MTNQNTAYIDTQKKLIIEVRLLQLGKIKICLIVVSKLNSKHKMEPIYICWKLNPVCVLFQNGRKTQAKDNKLEAGCNWKGGLLAQQQQ